MSKPSNTSATYCQLSWHSLWRAAWYCPGWTTVTLGCMELKSAVFRSCSTCRTLQLGSSFRLPDGRPHGHCWNSYTGSTTSWPSKLTYKARSTSHRLTSAVTSYLMYLLATSVLLPHLHSRNRSPELTSLTVLSTALHPLSGTH